MSPTLVPSGSENKAFVDKNTNTAWLFAILEELNQQIKHYYGDRE